MKKTVLVVALLSSLVFGAAIAPAQASYQDDLINAATNMIDRSDVPKVLGPVSKSTMFISQHPTDVRGQACEVPNEEGKYVQLSGKFSGQNVAFIKASSVGEVPFLDQSVMQFKGPKAAAKSFAQLAKDISKCNGTQTNNTQNTDGSTFTQTQTITTGTVKTATDGGKKPVFVLNSASTSGQYESGFEDLNAGYTVFSLANNVISYINYQPKSGVNMTNKTKKAVDQLSMKAAARWVG